MSYCNSSRRAGRTSSGTIRRYVWLLTALLLPATKVTADAASAARAMENPDNPLVELSTSRGSLFIEMLADEAPINVARVMALAQGETEVIDPDNGFSFFPQYYDGQRFHRVIPGFVIQAASPANHPLGGPGELLDDEINADSLGLDREPVLHPDASVNILLNVVDREDFATDVLAPLYAAMGIIDANALATRQQQVYDRLHSLTVKSLYEMQGYEYVSDFPTRPINRGIVALANTGPNSNGAEFFITLADLPTLTGKYTVIGRVVEGMEVADAIGNTAIDPLRFSRLSAVIYSFTQVNDTSLSPAPGL